MKRSRGAIQRKRQEIPHLFESKPVNAEAAFVVLSPISDEREVLC